MKKCKVFKLGNKAFTLTELIAVIVILSIVITMSVTLFVNIRKSALEKEYKNLVTYLEAKGIEYVKETGVATISVEDLIKGGFIKPDEDTDIYDPRDNSSMNCKLLKMEFKDDEYVAQLLDNGRDENGKCHEYTKTSEYQICRVDGDNCTLINDDEWFNKDLTLGVMFHGKLLRDTQVKYNWSTNTGFTSNSDIVDTDVKLIGNIIYKCEVTNGDVVGIATKNVRIDKEMPVIEDIKVDTNWSTSKLVEVVANDGLGSGIAGYAIVKENEKCTNYNLNNKIEIKENGNYKVCVSDKVGNITTYTKKINSIDFIPENPVITASDGLASGKFHSKDYTLSWKSAYKGTQDLIYYYGTDKNNLTNKGASVTARKNQYNVTMYVKACTSESNLCSGVSSYLINVDTTPSAPVITASDGLASGKFHSNNYTLSWKSTNQGSQNLIYYYGTDKNNLTNKGTSVTARKDQYNITMYVKACTSETNLCSGVSSYLINVDTTPSAPVIMASDGLASGKFHSNNYTLSWKSTNQGSQNLTYYYGTDASKMNKTGTSMSVNADQFAVYVYVKACTVYNKCSSISKYLLNLDTEPPVIKVTSNNDGRNYFTLTATITDSQSGIVAYAVTGYETPKNWISVTKTKSLNISRSFTWKDWSYYNIYARDAMGNVSKLQQMVNIDRDYPDTIDHIVYYNCANGKMFVGAGTRAAVVERIYYYTSNNKTKPDLNASGWSLGCSGITKYEGSCSGSKIKLNRNGDTYVWVKACNRYNECTIAPIGHAVCDRYKNTDGITYDSNMASCYSGYLTYDINTDKYICIDRWSAAQNISDKNLEVSCAENIYAKKFLPIPGSNYCCQDGYTLNTNFKMGPYYACEKVFDLPQCYNGKVRSTNNGYCT